MLSACASMTAGKSHSAENALSDESCRRFLHLPPTQPQCDYVNYHHDESKSVEGPGRCTTDCECDGQRTCLDHVCTGLARPTGMDQCHKPDYRWNEDWNGGGPGLCANDCECNGTRSCVFGHCQDKPAALPEFNGHGKHPQVGGDGE
jgi:hypothetical protein